MTAPGKGPGAPPRRILYVIGGLGRGGAERQLLELASGLDRREFEPLICSMHAGYPHADDFSGRRLAVVELERRGSWDLGRLRRLRALIRAESPALVHAFLMAPARYVRLACLGLRPRPRILVAQRTAMPAETRFEALVDWLLLPFADGYVANAERVREAMQRRARPWQLAVEVIPNGFDPAPIEAARPREETRARLGWGDERVLLTVGRLADAKDLPTLVRAFERLAARPGLRLVIAGEGPERAGIEAWLAGRNLPVTLLGERNDVPDLLRAADIFVLASKIEGLPNALGEAMLAGLPVVATCAGGIPELVRDGVDGCLVPTGDPEALARALGALLDDPARAAQLGASGQRRIHERFSLRAMIESTQEIYRELLGAPARSPYEPCLPRPAGSPPTSPAA